jgi:hypothetical protein
LAEFSLTAGDRWAITHDANCGSSPPFTPRASSPCMLLAAVMWHLHLPAVALSWWLLLGALRQLLSRLAFKLDLVFAGLAAMLVGQNVQIVAAMTLMASLILAAHVFVGAVLGASACPTRARN